MTWGSCQGDNCKNNAKFFVSQRVRPQRLPNGDMETFPAARSVLSCGRHLAGFVESLGSLSIRTNESVRITLKK